MKNISVFALSMGSGGAERVISLLLPKLEKDYNVTLFLMFNVFHYSVPSNVRVILVSNKSKLSAIEKCFLIPVTFIRYFRFIRTKNIDISVSFLTLPNLLNSLIKIFHKKLHVVISERNYPSIEYKSSYFRYYVYKILIPRLYSRADILFSNSKWINKDLENAFGVKTRMEVIYNPILLPLTVKHFDDPSHIGNLKFINVGRIFATKNQRMIIDAFLSLKNQDYSLTFLGEGIMREQLEQLVEVENAKSNIRFLGNVIDVNNHLLKNDCFILSSNSEGFPNALLEAMAMGLPVISTNCKSGPLELLNEDEYIEIKEGCFAEAKYGVLINVNDSIGLSRAIQYFMDNKHLLKSYSERSLIRANDFKLDIIYKRLKDLVLEIDKSA